MKSKCVLLVYSITKYYKAKQWNIIQTLNSYKYIQKYG